MRFRDVRIGNRLGLGFVTFIALTIIICSVALIYMRAIDHSADHIRTVAFEKMTAASRMINAMTSTSLYFVLQVANKEAVHADAAKEAAGNYRKTYASELKKLEKLETTAEGKELIGQFKQALAPAKAANDKLVAESAGKAEEVAKVYMTSNRQNSKVVMDRAEEVLKYEEDTVRARFKEMADTNARLRMYLIGLGLITVAACIAISLSLTRSITAPLDEGVKVADRLAKGELDIQVVVDRGDEAGRLLASMGNMVGKWKAVVGEIAGTATNLSLRQRN